ncbi:MAG TPA: RNA polymerase sigma factor [Candidatus Sulfopaludibacter sp.]|nr:RNA polymerase sigma factor [Candidatus Sulfopaludibacter sp.]
MNSLTDQQLLRDYAGRRSEAAFAEIVRRHVDLVYAAALRMVRDAHLAEDVTQGTFVALARSAHQLVNHSVLSGWLHRTARNLAANVVRSDVRRRTREQEVAAMNELLTTGSEATWEEIAPHLDAALGELNEADRDAVLLRYFEKKSAVEMAGILGISDDAAQKRVSRAVERLRQFFSKRNVAIGASGLAVLISANAVQSAPMGLAAAISAAVVLAGTTVSSTTAIATTKVIAMTALQKTIIGSALVAAIGTGVYEAREAASARAEAQTVQQQRTLLTEQVSQSQRERNDAINRLAASLAENERLQSDQNESELLKLRAEATRLRTFEEENNSLKMKISQLEGRWRNVTNAPQYSMPYFPRGKWQIYGAGDPLEILLAAASAATDGDEIKLSEVISNTNNLSLFSKQRWDNVKGIQHVNTAFINNNGKETAVVDTIILKQVNTGEQIDPNQPSALTELEQSFPEMHRWYFSKTEGGWKITGGD